MKIIFLESILIIASFIAMSIMIKAFKEYDKRKAWFSVFILNAVFLIFFVISIIIKQSVFHIIIAAFLAIFFSVLNAFIVYQYFKRRKE